MNDLLKRFNWRNFLQRTILFLAVFIIIRLLVDWMEGDVSLLRVLRLSLVRYLAFAMILGLLDSENWQSGKEKQEEEKVLEFASLSAAIFHYAGVAFFISLLCGFIFFLFFLVQWLVNYFTGKANATLFPHWLLYLLVIVAIGVSFAAFDAYRNYRRKNRR
jgi:hypothetical protein